MTSSLSRDTAEPSLSAEEAKVRRNTFRECIRKIGWEDNSDGPPPCKIPTKRPFVLDLSKRSFKKSVDLKGQRFYGWFEKNGEVAEWHTDFTGSKLYNAHFNSAILRHACFRNADLRHAEFMGQASDLVEACFAGARLWGCNMDQASVEGVDWGKNYKLGDELEAEKAKDNPGKKRLYREAEGVYRNLKRWHNWQGMYERAGQFHYREWECKRKRANIFEKVGLTIFMLSCGYLERPGNVVVLALFVILIFSIALGFVGKFGGIAEQIYFSLASFTAVGYGAWIDKNAVTPIAQWCGVIETLFGVVLISLFLITVTRKFAR